MRDKIVFGTSSLTGESREKTTIQDICEEGLDRRHTDKNSHDFDCRMVKPVDCRDEGVPFIVEGWNGGSARIE